MTSDWYSQARQWSIRLVQAFSQTDTPSERDFGHFLYDAMAEMPYFKENPSCLRLVRTTHDPLERYVVFGLVRGGGTGAQTLILTGHYDVVSVENYGPLQPWAADPEALLPRLIESLEAQAAATGGLPPAERLALDDLKSGDFLPGRGLLDMKSGLAAGVAVMERWAQLPPEERPGSLLFIAVPDEEIASHGARSAALVLPALAEEWGLSLNAAINLDASNDHGDGSEGQCIYLGTVGKLLPSVYIVGRETHAGSPFSGVNANLIAAELTRLIECNPEFIDSAGGEYSPPPVCLKQVDTKAHYDVTTPQAAWCFYNWLTLGKPVDEILGALREMARQALVSAQRRMDEAAQHFASVSGRAVAAPGWQAQVYTFAEVKEHAVQAQGDAFLNHYRELEQRLSADPALDAPTVSLQLTQLAWEASGLLGPAAVVGVAAIYYPPASPSKGGDSYQAFKAACMRQAERVGQKADMPVAVRLFFPGISDISYFGGQVSVAELELLAANSPAWKGRTGFDFSKTSALGLPTANIGPWGRDYHQRIERVHAPYSFGVLPELLWELAHDILS